MQGLGLERELALGEVLALLLGAERHRLLLRLAELGADGLGLLGAQVLGHVLLALVVLARLGLGLLVQHREDARDGLAHDADLARYKFKSWMYQLQ